jgi:5-methylcytosine-specific restriction endonuclease McrA
MPRAIPTFRPQQVSDPRKTRQARGYDREWEILRAAFLRRWLVERGPYCAQCGRLLVLGRQTHVDHVIPFRGVADPLRLDEGNLQVLCEPCNSGKKRTDL